MNQYRFRLPDSPQLAAGQSALNLQELGPNGFALALQRSLRQDVFLEDWHDSPATIWLDPVFDPRATVTGRQEHLAIELLVKTSLGRQALFERLDLLAGKHWELVVPAKAI
ncbi:hypothetical protein [Pseudomarimonas arenosa]|uniref:Uncharacterized protein n=1 Tax=Pseudomarimonas arenosa TaxID=2774145 RepID=A0AAW3ZNY9_9GAMM|nr:hypothetical protein [Pseudomarimonas arenosa]MBD8527438.1 hypothetical protein [Pseudomarimonas arenosa]